MCNYRINNNCKITSEVCPWVYWCDKLNTWKELSKAPKSCKIAEDAICPNGMYKVLFERKNFLYVKVDGQVVKILNPYDYIPVFVKLRKYKNLWKITKGELDND